MLVFSRVTLLILYLSSLTLATHHHHNFTRFTVSTHRPKIRHRKTTTTTIAPLSDDDYDTEEPETTSGTSTPKPAFNKTLIVDAKNEKKLYKPGYGSGAFRDFFRTVGFSLTIGSKKGLNLRIGPLDEETQSSYSEKSSQGEAPFVQTEEESATTVIPAFVTSIKAHANNATEDVPQGFGVSHIRPAVIHPRTAAMPSVPQIPPSSVHERHLVLIEGKPFLLFPFHHKVPYYPSMSDFGQHFQTSFGPQAEVLTKTPRVSSTTALDTQVSSTGMSSTTDEFTTALPSTEETMTTLRSTETETILVTTQSVPNLTTEMKDILTTMSTEEVNLAKRKHLEQDSVTQKQDEEDQQIKAMRELNKAIEEFIRVAQVKRRVEKSIK